MADFYTHPKEANEADFPPAQDAVRATPKRAAPKRAAPKRATVGGQPGNTNNLQHGLRRESAFRFALGKLPKSMARAEIDAQHVRLALETAVVERHGEIDLPRAGLIATAATWQRHSALCTRWLREHAAEMTHAERLSYSREICTAAANRDKAIAALRLEQTAIDAIDALYSSPLPVVDSIATPTPENATAATPEE